MVKYLGWIATLGFLLGLALAQPAAPRASSKVDLSLDRQTFDRLGEAMKTARNRDGFMRLRLDDLTVRQLFGSAQGAISAHEEHLDYEARKVNRRVDPTVPTHPSPGDTVILDGMPVDLYLGVSGAFAAAKRSHRGTDVTVRLEASKAYELLYILAADIGTNFERAR